MVHAHIGLDYYCYYYYRTLEQKKFICNTPLPQVFSTIDFSIDTHWADLTDSRPDHFLLLIGFLVVLVLAERGRLSRIHL